VTDLFPALQRGLTYALLLPAFGAVGWRLWIAGGASALVEDDAHRLELGRVSVGMARAGAWCLGLFLPVWALRLPAQLMGFRDPFAPLSEDLAFLIGETFWGTVWLAQGSLALMGFGLFLHLAMRPPEPIAPRVPWGAPEPPPRVPGGWRMAGLVMVGLALTLALMSHALSVPFNRPLAVALDALHAGAAGVWIGGLALILGSGRGVPALLAAQLRAFSPIAMASVGVLLFAGILLSSQHLMRWENLWISPYGRVLALKGGMALVVMGVGALNWRRGLPSAHTLEGAQSLRNRATLEVGLTLVVLALTALLTGMSMPEGTH
jgi:putative copper export protein